MPTTDETKFDKKDALTIARLVKDGCYLELYMPRDAFADLRVMSAGRTSLNRRKGALKNEIAAIMDEYFPEFTDVFKRPLDGKAARQIMKVCSFPSDIVALGEEGVLIEIRKAVKKSVGAKKAARLAECARNSIGVDYGLEAARARLGELLEGLERLERQAEEMERQMEEALRKVEYADNLLGIKGIGVVTLAALLGETGDLLRFESPRQICRLAGYNLVESSSGKNKSGTRISKRGRKNLRSALYQMTLAMVASNDEMKRLYSYLKTREKNPLKKMQALVAVGNKILAIIHALSRNKERHDPDRAFGRVRKGQLEAAA